MATIHEFSVWYVKCGIIIEELSGHFKLKRYFILESVWWLVYNLTWCSVGPCLLTFYSTVLTVFCVSKPTALLSYFQWLLLMFSSFNAAGYNCHFFLSGCIIKLATNLVQTTATIWSEYTIRTRHWKNVDYFFRRWYSQQSSNILLNIAYSMPGKSWCILILYF